jgi:hypothetical protein
MPVEVISPVSRKGSKVGSIHRSDQAEPQPEPRPAAQHPRDAEPEPLLPVGEEPTKADADISGQDLGRVDPAHLRQLEQLWGRPLFSPNVSGSAMGVVGPEDD